jgi:6-phosphogluconolactonase
VTEKDTNLIDTYEVGRSRRPGVIKPQGSAGQTPFGFAFDRRGHLIVSEAFGGAADASAVSSYDVDDGLIDPISPSVGTTESAACWIRGDR